MFMYGAAHPQQHTLAGIRRSLGYFQGAMAGASPEQPSQIFAGQHTWDSSATCPTRTRSSSVVTLHDMICIRSLGCGARSSAHMPARLRTQQHRHAIWGGRRRRQPLGHQPQRAAGDGRLAGGAAHRTRRQRARQRAATCGGHGTAPHPRHGAHAVRFLLVTVLSFACHLTLEQLVRLFHVHECKELAGVTPNMWCGRHRGGVQSAE